MIQIQKKLKKWLVEEMDIQARSLRYQIEKGGIFLKDASVLAGIGVIGKNNLLLTPQFGPRVRLRAMFLDVELQPTGLLDFDPCADCDIPCFRACPQDAFRSGTYERKYCVIQMQADEANKATINNDPDTWYIRYCRACELSCPVAR
jgi:epoxyqueuosine reductase